MKAADQNAAQAKTTKSRSAAGASAFCSVPPGSSEVVPESFTLCRKFSLSELLPSENIIRSCVTAAFSSEIVSKNLFARMESKYQFPKWLRKSFPKVYFLATAN